MLIFLLWLHVSNICTCVNVQGEGRLLEKEILERLDALQEMMAGRAAEAQIQGGGEVPEEVQLILFAG